MRMRFEQGPIRPPSEAGSLLIRFTRNCPWNKCTFCPVYKRRKFSRRSLQEILQDIDTIGNILQDVKQLSASLGYNGEVNQDVLNRIMTGSGYTDQYKQVAFWLYQNEGTVFIQDANSLIMKTDELVQALNYLREKVPQVSRITTYARSNTVARKSPEQIKQLKEAGLSRIHIGLESGSDNVLQKIKKGATAEQHIRAGQMIVQNGITLSEYVIPGLGGVELSREHALETARVLNQINPDYIRLRTLHIPSRAPMFEQLQDGSFQMLPEEEIVREIRLFIQSLQGIQSRITSDHIMNLLEEVQGDLPRDKDYMLSVIDNYLQMPEEERLLFRLGRRGGALRSLQELKNPYVRQQLVRARQELQKQTDKDLESIIQEMGNQYI